MKQLHNLPDETRDGEPFELLASTLRPLAMPVSPVVELTDDLDLCERNASEIVRRKPHDVTIYLCLVHPRRRHE